MFFISFCPSHDFAFAVNHDGCLGYSLATKSSFSKKTPIPIKHHSINFAPNVHMIAIDGMLKDSVCYNIHLPFYLRYRIQNFVVL